MFHCKVDTKKEKLEDFKTAISSTVKSLANSQRIEVSFGNQLKSKSQNSIRLPDLAKLDNHLNYEEIRAVADSKSLRFRFSNNKIFEGINLREVYQKNFIKYQKKLDVKK